MWILRNFDLFIFLLVLATAIFPAIKVINLISILIKMVIKNRKNLNRWKNGIIELEDLNHLTPKEFQYWCGEFIKKLGYTDIAYCDTTTTSNKDIVCNKSNKTTYILCQNSSSWSSSQSMIDDQTCRKLIGEMVHDGIKKGLLITSGVITNSAIEYINTLPKEYEIELLEGTDIAKQYSSLHHKKYRTT